jgi:ornithine cyclodeaminase
MLIISEKEIQESYGMKDAIADVKTVLRANSAKKIDNPHRTVLVFPQHEASALYMPSADLSEEVFGGESCYHFSEEPFKERQRHKESSCCQMQKMVNI